MLNEKQFKQRQAATWSSLASPYDRYFATVSHPAEMQMLLEVKPRPGELLLDVACGTGSCAFLAAPMVAPSGKIIGIDLAPGMIEVATEKAGTRGTEEVSFEVMDAEKLAFKSAIFDAALCKWGLTLLPDYHKALQEILRVLKPGGRFTAMVFGRPEASHFVTVAARAAFKLMPSLVTHQSAGLTDFQFAADGSIEAAFNAADFTNVRSRRFSLMITCADGGKYFDLFVSGFGNFAYKLGQAERSMRDAVRRGVIESVERYQSREGIRLPLEVVLCTGEKPMREKERIASARLRSVDELVVAETQGVREISALEASQLAAAEGVLVLDVRAVANHSPSRVPGAKSAPRGRLEALAGELIDPGSVRQIIVYGEDGRSSRLAAQALLDMGYPNVACIGGFEAWARAKLPVESGSARGGGLFAPRGVK